MLGYEVADNLVEWHLHDALNPVYFDGDVYERHVHLDDSPLRTSQNL